MENELNQAEKLIKDIKTIKNTIHELQFKLQDSDLINYIRDMSQGIEYDWKEKENFAYELISQAETEQIDYERRDYYGD